MRRLLAIGAVSVLIFAAFALVGGQRLPRVSAQSSNSGNLALGTTIYPVSGCGLGPAFTFCDQAPGSQGEWATFFVDPKAAVTGVSVSIAAIPGLSANFAPGDFNLTTTPPPAIATSGVPCAGNLAANQTCTFFVAFSPTAAGIRQAQITLSDSEGDSLVINVEGTGSQFALTPPAPMGCTPAVPSDNAYMFCTQPISPPSPTTETFTLSSASSTTGVNVTLAAIPGLESEFASGASGDFTITTPPCPSTIPAGGTCPIGVAFTPTATGLRSAVLTATDDSGDTTTIYLAGPTSSGLTLVGRAITTEALRCAPNTFFQFCNMPVGGLSPSGTLKVENTSGAQITGLSVPTGSVIVQGATAPDFTVQSNSCSSVLDAGASCNITVAFTPTTSGLRQGAVVVTDAQGDIATLNLAGVGDDYSIAPQLPTEVSVIPGGTATFDATLTPDNVLGMNGEQVTFTCPTNLPTNTSCAVTPCPAAITPGTPVSVQMVLVTSSAKTVAPKPTGGCSSYGPSQAAFMAAPRGDRGDPPSAAPGASRSSPLYSALVVFALFGAFALLVAGFAAPENAISRKRVPLMLACAGLAAAMLTGCRHHAPTNTTATPTGVTNLIAHGEALDASGNSLNASRQFQVTLDVVSK